MAAEPDSTAIVAQLIEGLDPGALITGFVVIAEVIDKDGERAVWTDTHEGSTPWDTLGLLTWATNKETAAQRSRLDADGEDDE